MDAKSISRFWMIKRLRFFRLLYHLCMLGALLSFFLFGGVAVLVCLAVALVCFAVFDMMRLSLDYPAPGAAREGDAP